MAISNVNIGHPVFRQRVYPWQGDDEPPLLGLLSPFFWRIINGPIRQTEHHADRSGLRQGPVSVYIPYTSFTACRCAEIPNVKVVVCNSTLIGLQASLVAPPLSPSLRSSPPLARLDRETHTGWHTHWDPPLLLISQRPAAPSPKSPGSVRRLWSRDHHPFIVIIIYIITGFIVADKLTSRRNSNDLIIFLLAPAHCRQRQISESGIRVDGRVPQPIKNGNGLSFYASHPARAGVCGTGNAVWPSKHSQRGQHAQQFQRGCDKAQMQN